MMNTALPYFDTVDDHVLQIVFDHLTRLQYRAAFRMTCKRFGHFIEAEEEFITAIYRERYDQAATLLRCRSAEGRSVMGPGFFALAALISFHGSVQNAILDTMPPEFFSRSVIKSMFSHGWPLSPGSGVARSLLAASKCIWGKSNEGEIMLGNLRSGSLAAMYWILNYMTPVKCRQTSDQAHLVYQRESDPFAVRMPRIIDLQYFFMFVDEVVRPRQSTIANLQDMMLALKQSHRNWQRISVGDGGFNPARVEFAHERMMRSLTDGMGERRSLCVPRKKRRRKTRERKNGESW